jgi:hypothetical protein
MDRTFSLPRLQARSNSHGGRHKRQRENRLKDSVSPFQSEKQEKKANERSIGKTTSLLKIAGLQLESTRVDFGADNVRDVGSIHPAVLDDEGNILTPLGAPNTVLFRAILSGRARIRVIRRGPIGTGRILSSSSS